MKGLTDYDALGLAELVRTGEVKPVELVDAAIDSIEAVNPDLHAVIYKAYDYARNHADKVPMDGTFAGVPYMMKELATLWEGLPQTNSCKFFKDFVAPVDHELVTRLKRAGFLLVGKTNAPEFGWALTTEPEMYGKTHNPWRSDVTPAPTSRTMPAPSWPRIEGNSPSGSPPESVNASVWQMPVAFSSTSTSPAFGPSSWTVSITSGSPGLWATAALTSILATPLS